MSKSINVVSLHVRCRYSDGETVLRVNRKCFDHDMLNVYLSDYQIRKAEFGCHLCRGDRLRFSIEDGAEFDEGLVTVWRSRSGNAY